MSRIVLCVGVVIATVCGTVQGQEQALPVDPVMPAGYQHSGVAPLFHRRQVPVYPDCPPLAPGRLVCQ